MAHMTSEYNKRVLEFNKFLKKQLSGTILVPISVGKLTASKLINPHISVNVKNFGDSLPNSLRLKVLDITCPNANCSDRENVNYGNIRNHSICLRFNEWLKVYPEFEGTNNVI